MTALAGAVDAAVYLSLGRVFIANQTGNGVLLALGAVTRLHPGEEANADAVAGPAVSLLGFCLGAIAAGLLTRHAPHLWRLFVAQALLLAATAALPGPELPRIGVVAAAMGVQSVLGLRLGVRGVTTTVVTGTLASLFSRATAAPRAHGDGDGGPGAGLFGLVWVMYVAGAALGAAGALAWSFTVVSGCAAGVAAVLAALAVARARGWRRHGRSRS
nr:YoaK family protein [Streptomyces boncukensis]